MKNHGFRCDGTKGILTDTAGEEREEEEEMEMTTTDDPGLTSLRNGNSFAAMSKAPVLRFLVLSSVLSVLLLAVLGNLQNEKDHPSSGAQRLLVRSSKQATEIHEAAASIARGFSSVDASKNPIGNSIDKTNESKKTNIKKLSLFTDFVVEHEKIYANSNEYNRRQRIFYDNLSTILDHNANANANANTDNVNSHATWKMGINPFADRSQHELPRGLDKSALRNRRKTTNLKGDSANDSERASLLSSLPESVDWRHRGVTTPVKNQGRCGSCWAFASTAALESHIAIRTGKLLELSVQELVTCVPNPNHCGGTGGCNGNTAELAYDFVSSGRGIVTEWQWGYTSGMNHSVPACDLPTDNNSTIHGAIASIEGYTNLEQNDYIGLLTAVATVGPVAVNVAADGWHLYESGIFDDSQFSSSDRDINHVVVVEGYGTEVITNENTGEEHHHDYWLVRNSWGPLWGEDGYIRLKRDSKAAQDDCRPDATPSDGIACVGPDNNTIPPVVEVCGTSGILYDAVYPTGGHLLVGLPVDSVDARTK
jgi:cathepsin L